MFNFGSTEQQTSNAQSSETNIAEVNSSDSGDVKASVNISRNESVVGNSAAGAEDSSDIEDVPDAASLSDLVHGAEELAEELNKEDDELKAEASRIKEQRQSEIADKVSIYNWKATSCVWLCTVVSTIYCSNLRVLGDVASLQCRNLPWRDLKVWGIPSVTYNPWTALWNWFLHIVRYLWEFASLEHDSGSDHVVPVQRLSSILSILPIVF